MILYEGTYRLAASKNMKNPVKGKWAFSWYIKIIDFAGSNPDINHIRPIAVVAIPTGEGLFKSDCAGSLGKTICRDFNLDINRILWVEQLFDNPRNMQVASFKPKSYFGTETFYHITWRPIAPNELKAIQPFIPDSINTNS